MKKLRKLYFRIFRRYKRLELKYVSWTVGNEMIKGNANKPEPERWVLAKPEEDNNHRVGMVFLERKKRITE